MALAVGFSSCNSYLDELPDDRAEVDTKQKVQDLLVSAYPYVLNDLINEMSTDNITDNGATYTTDPLAEQIYLFEDVVADGNDAPKYVWQGYYSSVATCNQALQSIEEMGNKDGEMDGLIAEAKIIRAFSMFQLAQTFCMAWNPDKADEYLGLPYPTTPEKNVNTVYERGTLRELYEQINKDIEDALPNIDESYYETPKYHFNLKAAYAFAARFNLYYMNYDKCIEYASKVLGDNPVSCQRDYEYAESLQINDMFNNYVNSSEKGNLMLQAAYSAYAYFFIYPVYSRYGHNSAMVSYETYLATGPWGESAYSDGSTNTLYLAHVIYYQMTQCFYPKMYYFFEYTDKVAGTGYLHTVDPVFTGDETLLCRMEAYALTKQYDKAIADMNIWSQTHCKDKQVKGGEVIAERPVFTVENVSEFIQGLDYAVTDPGSASQRSIRKKFNPQGFTVEEGTQEDLLQMILHMRRLEVLGNGLRFADLKRYGIEYAHKRIGQESVIFTAGDLRGAVQLPQDVTAAGLEKNPR